MSVTAISSDRSEYINIYSGRFNIRDNSTSAEKTDSLQKKDDSKKTDPSDKDEKTQKKIEQLKKRDAEVKLHEQMHLSAAGSYAKGGATFGYTTGPDGKRYAVSGEVNIDTSKIPDNPEATITKAQTIRRAALAPADPSGQDRAVAAEATQMEMEARQELLKKQTQGTQGYTGEGKKTDTMVSSSLFNFFV